MKWYIVVSIVSAAFCLIVFFIRALYLIRLGAPKDLSKPAGSVPKGVFYSMTVAMMPNKKESAYKHLPTYTAGIVYHVGTFLVLIFFIWQLSATFTHIILYPVISSVITAIFAVSALCGTAILIKRIVKKELRYLSSSDDYISNIITTAAHLASLGCIYFGADAQLAYYLIISAFFIWLPFGKTKHLLYFFFARFQLGFFYGRRGCWPVKTEKMP